MHFTNRNLDLVTIKLLSTGERRKIKIYSTHAIIKHYEKRFTLNQIT